MTESAEVTFQYVVPKKRYKRACLAGLNQSEYWRRMFLGCMVLGWLNVVFMFVLLAVHCGWQWVSVSNRIEDPEVNSDWIIIYGCFNIVVFFLSPFVLGRMAIAISYRKIAAGPPYQVTMTTEGYKIDFGGSHSFYSWPKISKVVEVDDGFVFLGDNIETNSFEKAQLSDEVIQQIRELLQTVKVSLEKR